jgi:hypothetical protein
MVSVAITLLCARGTGFGFPVAGDGTDIMPPAMGQPINVIEKPSRTPGIARFEINRSLTGMGHERYASVEDIVDNRAVDELARRLFATGGVTSVHVNSSVITVALADGWAGGQLLDVIRGLYIYYPPADDPSASAVSGPPGEEATGGDASPTNGAAGGDHAAVGGTAAEPAGETASEPAASSGAEPAAGSGATESDTRQ